MKVKKVAVQYYSYRYLPERSHVPRLWQVLIHGRIVGAFITCHLGTLLAVEQQGPDSNLLHGGCSDTLLRSNLRFQLLVQRDKPGGKQYSYTGGTPTGTRSPQQP